MTDTTPPAPELGATQLSLIYDAVSKNIERENNLIHQRITWAILLSAGILAAEGVIINYLQDHFAEDYKLHLAAQVVIIFLTLVAIVFCMMSGSGVLAAHWQMQKVKSAYTKHKRLFRAAGYPRPFGKNRDHWLGSFNAFIFPFAMMVLWFLFLSAQVYQLNWLWSYEEKFKQESKSKEAQLNKSVEAILGATRELVTKVGELKQTNTPPEGTKNR